MARQLAGCAVKGGVHPQAQIGGLGDQAAQAEVPLPEGQADLGRGGGQGLPKAQIVAPQGDQHLLRAGELLQRLGQQGSEPLAIGGSAGEGGDFGPHQGEDLLGHLGAAQVEGPLVLQHMAGHAPPSLRLDAGHLPVDVFVGLLQRRVLCFLKAELPAALDLREGALALVGGFRQDFGGEAVQLLIHIRHS